MRRFPALVVIATVAAATLVGNGSSLTAKPTLYFEYAMNCTISIVNDSGQPVTSVAPGAYQVDIRTPLPFATVPQVGASPNDMTACQGIPQFQLTGPGINFFTTMSAGCVEDLVIPETFQPSSTYTATDLNQPTVAKASFTTLATGTPTAATVTYGGGKGVAQTQTDIVGSERLSGTLDATVAATGTLKLTTSTGKPVSKLTAGRYRFRVADRNGKTGLSLLGPKSKQPIVLASAGFTGTKSTTVSLTSGRWTAYTSLKTVRSFTVG